MKFNVSCASEYQPPRTELKNKENTLCKKISSASSSTANSQISAKNNFHS